MGINGLQGELANENIAELSDLGLILQAIEQIDQLAEKDEKTFKALIWSCE
jgi:hypothetical protein